MNAASAAGRRRAGTAWLWAAAAGLGLFYFLLPNPRLDFTPFNAHDSESYIALSRALLEGRGYTRSLDAAIYVPHTTWPPGLPVMLLPAVWLAGLPADLLPIKLATIAIAVAGLWAATAYAARVGGGPTAGALVLIGLGLNPYYWHFARIAMTEVPTFAWAMASLLLIETARIGRPGAGAARAFAVGVVAGFGMLIRGSFLGAIVAPAARAAADGGRPTRATAAAVLAYGAGFVVFMALWALRNRAIDTSGLGLDGIDQFRMIAVRDPVDPASPVRSFGEVVAGIAANLKWQIIYNLPRQVLPGLWADGPWRAAGAAAPFAAAGLSAAIVLAALSRRGLPLLAVWGPMALLYTAYSWGGSERFWTTISFLVIVSGAVAWAPRIERLRPAARAAILGALALLGAASLAAYIARHEAQPYRDARFAALADLFADIRTRGLETGSVWTPNPHAFRLITGRSAPMVVPARGIDPEFTHVIYERRLLPDPAPLGRIAIERAPWVLVALPAPRRASEIAPVLPQLERP